MLIGAKRAILNPRVVAAPPPVVGLPTTGLIGRYEPGIANFTLTGALINQWSDTSGNGNHLTAASTDRPTHKTDFFGGRVTFDGNDRLTVPAGISLNRRAFSMYVVSRGIKGGTNQALVALDVAPDLALYFDANGALFVRDSGVVTTGVDIGWTRSGLNTYFAIGGAANAWAGHPGKVYAKGSALAVGTEAGGFVGIWGNNVNFPLLAKTDIVAVLFYNVEHDTTTRNLVLDYLTTTYGSLSRNSNSAFFARGDSLTEGTQATDTFDYSWPAQLARQHSFAPFMDNRGNGGTQLTTYATASQEITWLADVPNFTNRVIILWMGTNDISAARTEAQIETDMTTYITNIRAADPGAIIIGCTILARGPFNTTQDALVVTINDHIKNTADFDHVVDLFSVSELSDPTNTTYFHTDQIHLVNAGYAVVATQIRTALIANGYL